MASASHSESSAPRGARLIGALLFSAFLASAALPAGVAQTVADVTIGVPLYSDFEDGPGDWSASLVPPPPPRPPPANPSWQHGDLTRAVNNPSWQWGEFVNGVRPAPAASTWAWGAPTSGPGVAYSGSNVWATNLHGLYNNNECGAIMSPPITIPAGSSASFSMMQWRHFERGTATGTIWDAGRIFVSPDGGQTLTSLTPTPGYDTGTLSTTTAACLNGIPTSSGGYAGPVGTTVPGPTYSAVSGDLSAFAGQTVRVLIAFGSEGSGVRHGWYVDDFAVTIDGATTVEDFESGNGGFSVVSSAPPPVNGPGAAYSGAKAWGTNLAGLYNANECAAIMSPPISVPTGSSASVSFMQWRHFQRTSSTGTIFDAGRLFVTPDEGSTLLRIDAPTPAYDTGTLSTAAAACLNGVPTTGTNAYAGPVGTALPPPTYSPVSASLSAYAGQTVRVVIAFASDASTQHSGWYIDDFAVTIDGVTSVEDFEDDNGGFTIAPTRPPTGPGAAYSGSKVWATNLGGDYNNNECAALLSPPIDLTGEGVTEASVSFMQWRHFERSSATGTIFDAGRLFVTTDGGESFLSVNDPLPLYDVGSLSTAAASCLNGISTSAGGYGGPAGTALPPPAYSAVTADLSGYVGSIVQFVIAFGSESGGVRHGWYIDDFAVTVNGETTVQDFESGNGGFSVITTAVGPALPKGWSVGIPDIGPASDSPMFATNPAGNHGPNECHWIESPPVDLGPLPVEAGAVVKASLLWSQWFRTSATTAAGVLQVGTSDGETTTYTIVPPTTGYPAKPTSTILDACLGHLEPGLGAFAGLIDPIAGDMVPFEADLTEFLGQTITVRFLFASTSSTVTNPGWYVDDVSVELSVVANAPPVPDDVPLPGFGGGNAGGWTSGGPVNTWAYGVTASNPAGHTAYKTNLNGNHDFNECSYIESPAVPGALLAGNPTVRFEHWHRIPGTSVNVPWAAGIVLVSGDGGVTWQHLAMPDYNKVIYQPPTYTEIFDDCLSAWGADIAGGGYGKASTTVAGNVDGWYTSTGDLSAYVGSPSVKVRFAYASDGTFAYEGWAIRAVDIGVVKVL